MAMEVTLGTGMSCISSVCRGEDNGSDNEDNLDDRQQRPNSSSPKCAMREKRNPDGPTSTFLHPDIEPSAQRLTAQGAKHWPDGSPGGEGAGAVRGVGPSEAVSNRPERRAGGRLTPEIVHPVTKRAIVTTEKRMWHIARDRIVDARYPLHAHHDSGKTDGSVDGGQKPLGICVSGPI